MGYFAFRCKRHNFRVVKEEHSPHRHTKTISRENYRALNINPAWTLEEARAAFKIMNKRSLLEKDETKKIERAAERVTKRRENIELFIPDHIKNSFELELQETYNENKSRLDTVLKHWETAQDLIAVIGADPSQFFAYRIKIFNYYKEKRWSPDYIKRITRMLNLWGSHYCRSNTVFYQPIPKLANYLSQQIVDLREEKKGIRKPALSLEWEELKSKESKFSSKKEMTELWNWLFIGLWFGLRPLEIDNLKNEKYFKIEHDKKKKVDVLKVYQTKLTNLPKDKRWKKIPIFFEEQEKAIKIIKSKKFRRPLNKTLEKYFDRKIETYSPRKGFIDLMLDRGFSLEDCSTFMGHASIEISWRHYKDKDRYNLPKSA